MMFTEEFLCIEPEVGKDLRFRYPELLTPEKQQQFERHLGICDACQEYWSIWREMALSQRLPALLQQARAELVQKQYQAALEIFTDAAKIDPQLLERADGLAFFTHPAWISLTAAHSPKKDLLPSLALAYDPAREALTAANDERGFFPIALEYAGGKVKANLLTRGPLILFELLDAREEFEPGITFVGRVSHPAAKIREWTIFKGQTVKLETLTALFGSSQLPEIVTALRFFKVFPR